MGHLLPPSVRTPPSITRPALVVDTDALWHAMQTDGRCLLVTNDWALTPQRMFELYRAAGVARIAVARKTISVLWAVLRDQSSTMLITQKEANM